MKATGQGQGQGRAGKVEVGSELRSPDSKSSSLFCLLISTHLCLLVLSFFPNPILYFSPPHHTIYSSQFFLTSSFIALLNLFISSPQTTTGPEF